MLAEINELGQWVAACIALWWLCKWAYSHCKGD